MQSLTILCLVFLVFQVAADFEEANTKDALDKRRLNFATFVLCEHKSGTLKCPGRKRLRILQANYGRTERYICPKRSIRTTYCISSFSSRLIRCACQNRNSCPLYAQNQVYGDPCRGTFKYIKVHYRCV